MAAPNRGGVMMGKLKDILTDDEADRAGNVFTTHQRFIESVAVRHAPAPDHVPDIVQTVGLQVCRGLNGFRSESEITTWLYRVTVNTARKYYRQERRHRLLDEALDIYHPPTATSPDQDERLDQGTRMEALQDAIDRLRPQDRAVVSNELQDIGVLPSSGKERAARHRARQQLKTMLEDDPRLDS